MRIHEVDVEGQLRTAIDTPIALTPFQRARVRWWASEWYRKKIKSVRGAKRAAVERILVELDGDTFIERPVPRYDSDEEVTLFGG